jgi:hypothetical protein
MESKRVNVIVTPVYRANKEAYYEKYPIICNEGGSRSSKSYSIVQLLIVIATQEKNKRISIVSPPDRKSIHLAIPISSTDSATAVTLNYSDLRMKARHGGRVEIYYLSMKLT